MPFSKLKSLNKSDKILFLIAVFLLITYFLSFSRTTDKAKKNGIKSALVNEKYLPQITHFIIKGNSVLNFEFNGNFWTIKENNSDFSVPADSDIVNSFLSELASVRNMYKISDKNSSYTNYALTDGTETTVRYYTSKNSDSFFDIIFGGHDFSNNSRYIMSGKHTAVYEIDTSLDTFITTSIQFWSDPYIISSRPAGFPKGISLSDVQSLYFAFNNEPLRKIDFPAKLLELRHGGFCTSIDSSEEILEFYIELGNKKEIHFTIYQTDSESYYDISADYGDYTAYYKISAWTYNSIKEMML